MNALLDELYLNWLYGQTSPYSVKNPKRTYWKFTNQLYQKEFIWFIPNDDNRAADGKDLRSEFLREHKDLEPDPDWLHMGCSMLELLVGMSRRLAFMGGGEPRDRFWEMVYNTEIEICDDEHYIYDKDLYAEIDQALDTVIWRTYSYSGHNGGLFPLSDPKTNQTKTELWYQMAAYILSLIHI